MISKEVLEAKFEFGFDDETVGAIEMGYVIAQAYKDESEEGNALVNSDHIFMGLLSKLDPRIFKLIQMDPKKLYDATKFILGPSRPEVDRNRIFSVDGEQDIYIGISEAKDWRDEVLEPEILFIGILRDSRNVASGIMKEIGQNENGARLAVARSRFESEQVKAERVYEEVLDRVRGAFLDPKLDMPQKHRLRRGIANLVDIVTP